MADFICDDTTEEESSEDERAKKKKKKKKKNEEEEESVEEEEVNKDETEKPGKTLVQVVNYNPEFLSLRIFVICFKKLHDNFFHRFIIILALNSCISPILSN